MELAELVLRSRSYRRFHQEEVSRDLLVELVGMARLCPSGANLQPIRYLLSCRDEASSRIFPHLRWAGYLGDWPGPEQGERPTAYIVLLGDREVAGGFGVDHGIAAQTILLGAVERGLGGCIIGSIDRDGLRDTLELAERYEILLVLALGKPAEEVVVEETGPESDIRYYRDPEGKHHVPKRPLGELILEG